MKVWQNKGVPIKAWIDGVQLEVEAAEQLENTASLPFIFKHIAVLPDVHFGMGATIGSVVPTLGAIVPATVGLDIGCGMLAFETAWTKEDLTGRSLVVLRKLIEDNVPHGRTNNGGKGDVGAWGEIPNSVEEAWETKCDQATLRILRGLHPELLRANALVHLGTLGTGNHFIEVTVDERDVVWVMLHSGSRGIGNKIGSHFIKLAKMQMKQWYIDLPDPNLAYFPEGCEYFHDYMSGVEWAQNFALQNRNVMMARTIEALEIFFDEKVRCRQRIDCHHNYVAKENHFGQNVLVTRKGATRAREGDMGIIPGSMGAKSYIVRGKGNPDSFNSCSHGAGRKMSRTRAKQEFSLADHEAATIGVECKKDASVLDETPGAYKSIEAVMAAQTDLVEVVHMLKQIVCIKG